MVTHMLGPWEHHVGLDYVAVKPVDPKARVEDVAHVYGRHQRDAVANARLIAAAPELLAALRDLLALYEAAAGEDECDLEDGETCGAPICRAIKECAVNRAGRARLAIAKATGNTQGA